MSDVVHVSIDLDPTEVAQVRAALAAATRWGSKVWTEEQRMRIELVGARLARLATNGDKTPVEPEEVTGHPPKR